MHPCRALLQRFAWVLQQSWHQRVPNFARRFVEATAGDVDGQIRSAERAAEVRDVSFYLAKVEALLTIRQIHWHRAGVDIVKRDPVEDILRNIPKHDNDGVSRLVNNFPVGAQQSTRRERDDTIAAVFSRENMLQGLRCHDPEIVRRKVTVSKTLDRRFEETLGFNIQVEKPIFKQASQLLAYSGLADAADASEKYSHVATFDEACAIST